MPHIKQNADRERSAVLHSREGVEHSTLVRMQPNEHQKVLLQQLVSIGQHREEERKRAIAIGKSTKTRLELLRLQWLDKSTLGREVASKRREEIKRQKALLKWFQFIDKDGGGSLDAPELEEPLISAGLAYSREEVVRLIQAVDDDGSGEVEFDEFLRIVENHTGSAEAHDGQGRSDEVDSSSSNPIKQLIARLDSGDYGDPDRLDLATRLTAHRRQLIMDGMLAQIKGVATSQQLRKAPTSSRSETPAHTADRTSVQHQKAVRTVEAIERYTRWKRNQTTEDKRRTQLREERRLRRKLRRLGVKNPRTVDPADYESYLRHEALAMLGSSDKQSNHPADAAQLQLRTADQYMAVDVFDDAATDAELQEEAAKDERRKQIRLAQRNRQWTHAKIGLSHLAKEVLLDRNAQDKRALQTRRDIAQLDRETNHIASCAAAVRTSSKLQRIRIPQAR